MARRGLLNEAERARLVDRLQRFLPLAAHTRPALSDDVCKLFPGAVPATSGCIVTSVFYAGAEHGIMCRLEWRGATLRSPTLVASIAQICIDRRHPISREIAAYRKRRSNAPCGAKAGSRLVERASS